MLTFKEIHMQHKRIIIFALLLSGLWLADMQAQTMYVYQDDESKSSYTLNDVRKVTFAGGEINIHRMDASASSYDLIRLKWLSFTDFTTDVIEPTTLTGSDLLIAFPNPVENILYIDLSELNNVDGRFSVLGLDGKVLLSRNVQGFGVFSLNLSHLPKGIYICRYESTTETQTVKIIKQ